MSSAATDDTRRSKCGSYTNDVTHYGKIVVALKETIRLMGEIDELIPPRSAHSSSAITARSSAIWDSTNPPGVRQRLPGQMLLPRVQQTLEPRRIDVLHGFAAHVQRTQLVSHGMMPQPSRRRSPSAERPVTEGNSGHEKRPASTYKASLIEVETVAGGSPCDLRPYCSTTRRQQSMRHDRHWPVCKSLLRRRSGSEILRSAQNDRGGQPFASFAPFAPSRSGPPTRGSSPEV